MSNISGKITLSALKCVIKNQKGANGDVECLIIPIAANNLFKSEKGNVYLDIQAFEITKPKEGSTDTHIVKQSLPKDVYSIMSDDEKKAMPILGNLKTWGSSGGGESLPPATMNADDDLPF